jgi:hypothetical protein
MWTKIPISGTLCTKLSVWAKSKGIRYNHAWRIWRRGQLPIPWEETASGRVIVHRRREPVREATALSARASSEDQRSDLGRQLGRLASLASSERPQVTGSIVEAGLKLFAVNSTQSSVSSLPGNCPGCSVSSLKFRWIRGSLCQHCDLLLQWYLPSQPAARELGRKCNSKTI